MKLFRPVSLILLISFAVVKLAAQSTADSSYITPFAKGRNYVGLSGSIRSSKIDNSTFNQTDQYINKYTFDISLGKFVANKNMVGLIVSATKNQSTDYVNTEQELITLGPLYRLYFGKKSDMGLFAQAILLGAYYVENSEGSQGIFFVDETVKGYGLGGDIGFGYAYVIGNMVSFEIGFNYLLAAFSGDLTDNHLGTTKEVNFVRHDYRFVFGFSLLFDKLKHD